MSKLVPAALIALLTSWSAGVPPAGPAASSPPTRPAAARDAAAPAGETPALPPVTFADPDGQELDFEELSVRAGKRKLTSSPPAAARPAPATAASRARSPRSRSP